MARPLAFHIALLITIELIGTESIIIKQSMVTSGRKRPAEPADTPRQDDYFKHLGEECVENEQCTHYASHALCKSYENISVCSCKEGFARKVADSTTCVIVSIEVSGNMLLPDEPWDDDMLIEGSEAFNRTTTMVADLLLEMEEVITITDIYIEQNNSVPEVFYHVLIYNMDAEQPERLRTWLPNTKQPEKDERQRDLMEEDIVYKIKEVAYVQGVTLDTVTARLMIGELDSFCFKDSDCFVAGSLCSDSACYCPHGSTVKSNAMPHCD